MFVNEELKKRIRLKLDGVLLSIKVAQTVEGHRDPEGADAVVEVLMEELMKLHSSYGKERVSCDSCGGCDEDGDEILPCVPDDEECCCCCQEAADENRDECSRTYDLPFGIALEAAKLGERIARKGWNGKSQYVFLAQNLEFHTEADLSAYEEHGIFVHDALAIKTSAEQVQVGWLASQSDMLSNDWYIVE